MCQLQHATCNAAAAAAAQAATTSSATPARSILAMTKLQQHFPSVCRSLVCVIFHIYFLFSHISISVARRITSACFSFDALKVKLVPHCCKLLYKTVCPAHTLHVAFALALCGHSPFILLPFSWSLDQPCGLRN